MTSQLSFAGVLAMLLAASSFAAVPTTQPETEPTTSPATVPTTQPATLAATLREAVGDRMLIGAAVMSHQLTDPRIAALVGEQFNCLTGENEFKPAMLHPKPREFDFAAADAIVAFAEAHGQKVIGHNLVWHSRTPAWMFRDATGKPLPRVIALAHLRDHIETVVKHFKGHVLGWDVVNEAIADGDGELRDTPAREAIGDDYIEQAFEFAHDADPNAELYYNDYNIEQSPKREKAIRLIRRLRAKGIRIDAVGIQGHWSVDEDPKTVDDAIKAFQAEGVKVMITEIDLDVLPSQHVDTTQPASATQTVHVDLDPYKAGLPREIQQKLADHYAALFQVFKERGVSRVTFWGVHDGTSYLNSWPIKGRTNYPLLFDRDLKSKPAFDAVLKVLSD